MMKLIVCLLLVFAVIAPGYSQRQCFRCTNCVQPFVRDRLILETCTPQTTAIPPPTTGPTSTVDPNTSTDSSTVDPNTSTPTTPTTTPSITTIPGDTTLDPNLTPLPPIGFNLYPTLRCFRVIRTVGDTTEVDRGCVEWSNTVEATCARIQGATAENCEICNDNECNAAIKNITSFGTFLTALLIVLKFY